MLDLLVGWITPQIALMIIGFYAFLFVFLFGCFVGSASAGGRDERLIARIREAYMDAHRKPGDSR